MHIDWDADKNRRNITKHKISFETAVLVFDDRHALSVQDRIVDGEERWQTTGMVDGVVMSARKAVPRERRAYAKNQQRSSN